MAKSKRPPHADLLDKAPSFKHSAYADWIETQTGREIDAKDVQIVMSLVGPWRKSEELAAAKANHVPLRDQRAAEVAERKKARNAEKAAKLRAQLAALEGDAAPAEPAPDNVVDLAGKAAKKTAKPAAKKAPAKAPKKAPAKAPKPAPAASTVDDDDDF